MNQIKIAPSILSADFSKMGEEVENLEKFGADLIHCDVMDGVFVKNITFGIKFVADIKKHTSLPLDCHLMIVNPENYVEEFAKAGANIITVHYEACKENLPNVLQKIKNCGVKCGAVINPNTPVSVLENVIDTCDMILLMSVYPGFGGQKFIPDVLEKIKQVKKMIEKSNRPIDLEIDGGITLENIKAVKEAGANIIVAGNTIFKEKDRKSIIERLKKE